MNYNNCYDMSVDDRGGGQSWDAGEPEIVEEIVTGDPDCTKPQTQATTRAYCENKQPSDLEAGRLRQVIAAMAAKGGVCATIASYAGAALDNGRLHMFEQASYPTFGGAAQQGGGADGIMVLARDWTDSYYDAAHATSEAPPRDLSTEIAHEGDHLAGYDHVLNLKSQTPHMFSCSDLT